MKRALKEMTREELIEEVKRLRRKVQSLQTYKRKYEAEDYPAGYVSRSQVRPGDGDMGG